MKYHVPPVWRVGIGPGSTKHADLGAPMCTVYRKNDRFLHWSWRPDGQLHPPLCRAPVRFLLQEHVTGRTSHRAHEKDVAVREKGQRLAVNDFQFMMAQRLMIVSGLLMIVLRR